MRIEIITADAEMMLDLLCIFSLNGKEQNTTDILINHKMMLELIEDYSQKLNSQIFEYTYQKFLILIKSKSYSQEIYQELAQNKDFNLNFPNHKLWLFYSSYGRSSRYSPV